MHLKEGSFLQGGRYRIERMLGQGGFGITYLGMQTGLNRKVAIKEFFMKEYCNREKETSHVSVPSIGSKNLVERFRQKFVKEAQIISEFSCPNIIRIYDVFEENGTAYYVMEYHGHGSLSDLVMHRGRLEEAEAVSYIRQVAEALRYIHERNINHLDVKPSNVLLDNNGRAVLIDFGMSKRYDVDGEQTSTTPVGISHGYAPLEQYKKGGVGTFSPATDIYSLGATFYKLVTGITPPDASEGDEDGLYSFPCLVSDGYKQAIRQAMNMKRKDRPQSVVSFLSLLDVSADNDDEETFIEEVALDSQQNPKRPKWSIPLVLCLLIAIPILILGLRKCLGSDDGGGEDYDSVFTDTLVHVDTIPVIPSEVDEPLLSVIEDKNDDVPVTCTFSVTTSPVGASVYVDRKNIGKTPIERMDISQGKHMVKLVLDGYESFTRNYTFGDKPIIINETLVATEIVSNRTFEKTETYIIDSVKVTDTVPELAPVKVVPTIPKPLEVVTTGTINGHAYVDLGLSVKWATMNVGAVGPEDYGEYFDGLMVSSTDRYDSIFFINEFKKDTIIICGDSHYDAARYNWGGNWRLPTVGELVELKEKCNWTWCKELGHPGYKVIGPNGNSIFLPASGNRIEETIENRGTGCHIFSGVFRRVGNQWEVGTLFFHEVFDFNFEWLFVKNASPVRPVAD